MISRKIEVALIIIGAVIFVLFGVSGASMIAARNDDQLTTTLYQQLLEELPDGEAATYPEFIENFQSFGIMVVILAVISIVAGILAIFMLKGNKRPKPAGILLLIVGILIGFLQFGIALFGSLFYVIVGMMALLRKPKYEPGS
ncbi:DUF4064 domain-containing protein [Amphibacillus sp. MSJ-3]|uniref:DUF4064 domain-containing protein n=1 Tax=Amphibacillus sp. MSJ-3 TaxID=2841505 RepID=UPI001C0EB5CD|nr:DUF4064 domain-containing protein [Amphibacillus sp. MSJ-3]MBU5594717.1 DUF4064 domain-containing protein [Amphibacillus sp. MSJ-3]